MSKLADSIRRRLKEAVTFAKSEADAKTHRVHAPEAIDVKAIRTKLHMTQEEFAGRFGFSVNTLRHWESIAHPRQCRRLCKPRDGATPAGGARP